MKLSLITGNKGKKMGWCWEWFFAKFKREANFFESPNHKAVSPQNGYKTAEHENISLAIARLEIITINCNNDSLQFKLLLQPKLNFAYIYIKFGCL